MVTKLLCAVCFKTSSLDQKILDEIGMQSCLCLHCGSPSLSKHPLSREDTFTRGTYIVIQNFGLRVGKKTNTYAVYSKDDVQPLGSITWFGRWRKYSFNPSPNTTYEWVCMRELSLFCQEETIAHMESVRQKKAAKA